MPRCYYIFLVSFIHSDDVDDSEMSEIGFLDSINIDDPYMNAPGHPEVWLKMECTYARRMPSEVRQNTYATQAYR